MKKINYNGISFLLWQKWGKLVYDVIEVNFYITSEIAGKRGI